MDTEIYIDGFSAEMKSRLNTIEENLYNYKVKTEELRKEFESIASQIASEDEKYTRDIKSFLYYLEMKVDNLICVADFITSKLNTFDKLSPLINKNGVTDTNELIHIENLLTKIERFEVEIKDSYSFDINANVNLTSITTKLTDLEGSYRGPYRELIDKLSNVYEEDFLNPNFINLIENLKEENEVLKPVTEYTKEVYSSMVEAHYAKIRMREESLLSSVNSFRHETASGTFVLSRGHTAEPERGIQIGTPVWRQVS